MATVWFWGAFGATAWITCTLFVVWFFEKITDFVINPSKKWWN